MALIIRQADVQGQVMDVRVEGGMISSLGSAIPCQTGDEVLDAGGGALAPGLHDHHIHLRAWAASMESVFVGPSAVSGERGFAAAIAGSVVGEDGWVRAVGYHESVAGDLDRDLLDRLVPDRPVRVQHRSGILWVLNTAALELVDAEDEPSSGVERGSEGRPTGRLWRMDAWLADRLALLRARAGSDDAQRERRQRALSKLSQEAASRGVIGWTDATPGRSDTEAAEMLEAVSKGSIRQRLHLMMPVEAEHRPSGLVSHGPVKVLLDDTDLPPLDRLSDLVSQAHRHDRSVAVHCVTAAQLALTVAAFGSSAGEVPADGRGGREGDRIEHGAIIPPDFLGLLADHRLTVVTQPNFIFERGDEYMAEVEPEELPDLWRGRSLLSSGVPLAAGSDAPFGSADPWVAVRASVRRLTRSGSVLGADETLDWNSALRLWLGEARFPTRLRRVEPGQPADLVLLHEPLPYALEGEDRVEVRATLIGGECVFGG